MRALTTPRRNGLARAAALLVAAAAFACAGCGPERSPLPAGPLPEVTPERLLLEHHRWVASLDHLWAKTELLVNFPVSEDKREQHLLAGHLMLQRPDLLYVHGRATLVGEVLVAAAGAERYWLYVRPEINTVYVGERGGPGEARLFLPPTLLIEALGLVPVEPGPGRGMRLDLFGRDAVLTETLAATGQVLRRIWFDRATSRPRRIDLYDAAGQRRVMSELLAYEPVGGTDVCTSYRVRFLGEQAVHLALTLKDAKRDKAPNPKLFVYRRPPGAEEVDLDAPPPRRATGPAPVSVGR